MKGNMKGNERKGLPGEAEREGSRGSIDPREIGRHCLLRCRAMHMLPICACMHVYACRCMCIHEHACIYDTYIHACIHTTVCPRAAGPYACIARISVYRIWIFAAIESGAAETLRITVTNGALSRRAKLQRSGHVAAQSSVYGPRRRC
jgi:hypothetical protein